MPSIYENDVIRYLRRKGADGFIEPVSYLGSEQRFVTGLRNSSVNNLEEQYLLGTDTYTEVYEDSDENIIIEKSFHVNSDDPEAIYSDYYKLVTTVYKDNIDDKSFYFNNDKLVMPEDINKIIFGNGTIDYPDLNTLYGVDENTFDFVNDTFNVYPSEFSIVRKDELFFITDNGSTEKPVLTKTISKRYEKTGGKVIYKEDIENHLV